MAATPPQTPLADAHEVAPRLWVGSFEAVVPAFLEAQGIRAILGLCPLFDPELRKQPQLRYEHLPIADDVGNSPIRVREVIALARELWQDGQTPTLIYCQVGRSRSVAVAAAVIALRDGLPFLTALDRVREQREIAVQNSLVHIVMAIFRELRGAPPVVLKPELAKVEKLLRHARRKGLLLVDAALALADEDACDDDVLFYALTERQRPGCLNWLRDLFLPLVGR